MINQPIEPPTEPLYRRILRVREQTKPVYHGRDVDLFAWESVPADLRAEMLVAYRQYTGNPKAPLYLVIGTIYGPLDGQLSRLIYTACADWYADPNAMMTEEVVFIGVLSEPTTGGNP